MRTINLILIFNKANSISSWCSIPLFKNKVWIKSTYLWSTDIGRSFIVLLNLIIPLFDQKLWIFFALFKFLHIQARHWLLGVKFSQVKSLFSLLKPNFELLISLLTSNFFSSASFQTLRLTNLTIVLDLPSWWQPSISGLEILIFRCENISITFCSNCSSFTFNDMPYISRSFHLVHWSCLFEAFSKSKKPASSFSHFLEA